MFDIEALRQKGSKTIPKVAALARLRPIRGLGIQDTHNLIDVKTVLIAISIFQFSNSTFPLITMASNISNDLVWQITRTSDPPHFSKAFGNRTLAHQYLE